MSLADFSCAIDEIADSTTCILALFQKSPRLLKRFTQICSGSVSSPKKSLKNFFFQLLGYAEICSNKLESDKNHMGESRVHELKDAFNKLFRLNADGTGDMTWWKAGPFEVICASKISADLKTEQKVSTTDKLLRSEESLRAFKKFLKFSRSTENETTLSFVSL